VYQPEGIINFETIIINLNINFVRFWLKLLAEKPF